MQHGASTGEPGFLLGTLGPARVRLFRASACTPPTRIGRGRYPPVMDQCPRPARLLVSPAPDSLSRMKGQCTFLNVNTISSPSRGQT
ncbi:hypothetical protein CSC33_1781 [Pseudomonas aeruginosa]|nr:hypothetical protein CSC33_1781 [Pseudomonas aeruginosa]